MATASTCQVQICEGRTADILVPNRSADTVSNYQGSLHGYLRLTLLCSSEQDLLICDSTSDGQKFAPLRILCFDIETNVPTARANQFSDAKNDPVIQIGNMVFLYGKQFLPRTR